MILSYSPTITEATKLDATFNYYNRILFNSTLEPCRISIVQDNKGNWVGCFQPQHAFDKDGNPLHEIKLKDTYVTRCIEESQIDRLHSTLVHEMCHQATENAVKKGSKFHPVAWREMMEELGLPPVKGHTWRNATHEIDKDGIFLLAFKAIPQDLLDDWLTFRKPCEKKRRKPNKIIHTCPECGDKAYTNREGMVLFCGSGHDPVKMESNEDVQ